MDAAESLQGSGLHILNSWIPLPPGLRLALPGREPGRQGRGAALSFLGLSRSPAAVVVTAATERLTAWAVAVLGLQRLLGSRLRADVLL